MSFDTTNAAAPAAAVGAPYLLQLLSEVAGSKNSASAVSDVCKVWLQVLVIFSLSLKVEGILW